MFFLDQINWTSLDSWIVLTGALIAMACALPGIFLILNRNSMIGDGISHAILPGIALAFLLTGSRDWFVILLGAATAGIITIALTRLIQNFGQVESGAALGVVFCSLFALGLILIRVASDHVDLNPDCVLHGSIETAVVDFRKVPLVTTQSAIMLLVNLALTLLFYKELRISAFDPSLAATLGFHPELMRYCLTTLTSITAVMAFEAVGSILVIAMLIVPGATALLLTHKLHWALLLTLLFAALSGILGHVLAIWGLPQFFNQLISSIEFSSASTSGMIATTAGILFMIALGIVKIRQCLNL
ncbi:MAG: metal ABC transporter permease [Verrucomicrobiota bacterium]